MIFFRFVIIWCAIVTLVAVDTERCKNGAECISLKTCTELYSQLQKGANSLLVRLIRNLHCGFEEGLPQICCPPIFMQSAVESTVSSTFTPTLLPDYSTCGIFYEDSIIAGIKLNIDEHPWLALLRYNKPDLASGFYCGGVLISSRYVLTAGHCVKGQDSPESWQLTEVRLGEWNSNTSQDCQEGYCSDPPLDFKVEEIIIHEKYDPQSQHQHNDIALLRLAKDVNFTDYVKPICLPTSPELRNENYEGHCLLVAGWGKTETRSESDIKSRGFLPVVNNTQCRNVFARVNRDIDSTQVCAGGEGTKDSCRTDSGGPLIAVTPSKHIVAVGVFSYGPSPCDTPVWPGVYTRVGYYIDWILSKIRL